VHNRFVVESLKGQSFFFKSAKQDIRIDYNRLLTYQSGRSKFFGAKVAILDRAGRNFHDSSTAPPSTLSQPASAHATTCSPPRRNSRNCRRQIVAGRKGRRRRAPPGPQPPPPAACPAVCSQGAPFQCSAG